MRRIILLIAAIGLTSFACSGIPLNLPIPSPAAATITPRLSAATLTPFPTRTRTVYVTTTPIPTRTAIPTQTATITPTPMPLPAAASLKTAFQNEIQPLAARLKAAAEAAPPPELKPDDPVILVPESENLHYVQSILFLDRPPATAGERRLYVLYSSSRGASLGMSSFGMPAFSATTQALTADLRLVLQEGGRLILVEKKTATGGAGSKNYLDMVERAVLPFDRLGSQKTAVEKDLQQVIGYAGGLNMDTRLDSHRRTALFASAMQSSAWADRKHAADAFKEIIPPPAAGGPVLVAALDDSNSTVRSAAAASLKIFVAAGEAVPLVIEAGRSAKTTTRDAAADILGAAKKNPQEALQALTRLLQDPVSSVRVNAASSLGDLALVEAVPALSAALADRDAAVRGATAEALGLCGKTNPAAVIPALSSALKDGTAAVRGKAAAALGKLGSGASAALPELLAALKVETDGPTFGALAASIQTLGGKTEQLPALIEATRAKDAGLRRAACSALGGYKGTPGAVEALTAALGDSDRSVVSTAISALGGFGAEAKDALPALIRLLEGSPTESEQQILMSTLGKIGPGAKAAVPALIKALSSANSSVRTGAKNALKAVTGSDFSEDKARWEQWWAENK